MPSVRSRGAATHHPKRLRGVALVAVLWMIVILAILVVGTLHSVRVDSRMAASALEAARARSVLDGALRLAAAEIALARVRPVAPYSIEYQFAGSSVRVDVVRESGYISVNSAPESLLRDLFMFGAGLPENEAVGLAQRVIDWRDPDHTKHPDGAEIGDYRAAGLVNIPRNEDFLHPDDLGQVLGMTPAVHANIRDLISVGRGGGAGTVNPLTAPLEVLNVLARGDRAIVDRVRAARDSGEESIVELSGFNPRHASEWFGNQFRLRAVLRSADRSDWVRTASLSLEPADSAALNAVPWQWLHADPAVRIPSTEPGN